jgi:hypothetical protein
MSQGENFAGISLDSISVDEEGRVIVTDPQLAQRLRSVEAAQRRNTNNGCNTVRGCGDGQHINPGCVGK